MPTIVVAGKDLTAPSNQQFSLHSERLVWRPFSRTLPRPGPALQSWLLDQGSLTLRLREQSADRFRVVVVEEGWVRRQVPSLLQCFTPSVACERMWSRRVLLQCGDTPWVAAHSLIPVSSMEGQLKRLRRLNTKPLGEFLFRNPLLQRRQLELTQADDVWGRRSLFYLYGKPLLVAEFFLPALLRDTGVHLE